MSNWPTVPFYILSQLNLSNLVVVLNSDNHAVLAPLAGTADQLWVATPDVRGGARLTNLLSGLALYGRTGDPSWVGAGPVDLSVSGGGWVLDDFPSDGWHRIECLPASNNWWMQYGTEGQDSGVATGQIQGFILAGWNGGQVAEFQVMPETGSVTVTNLAYNLAAAKNTPLPPVDFLAVEIDNTQNSTSLTQTITLTGSIQQSTQFQNSETDTEGTVYTQSFSVEGKIGPVDVTATATFEENQSQAVGWSSGTATTSTSEHDIQTEVTVPGNKKYSLQQRVNYGQVDVPWTATATFQSSVPNVKPYAFQMTGTFTGLNATSSEVTVADVTSGRPGANGQGASATSVPVPLSGSAATVPTL
jgi:hypothetical protein